VKWPSHKFKIFSASIKTERRISTRGLNIVESFFNYSNHTFQTTCIWLSWAVKYPFNSLKDLLWHRSRTSHYCHSTPFWSR